MAEEPGEPIRICLLVDGNTISNWQYAAVTRLVDETNAEVSLVIRNRADRERSRIELLRRAVELREWTVVALVRKLIADSPSGSVSVAIDDCAFASDARFVDCVPETVDGWKTALPDGTAAAVRGEADVGILFGFGVLVGDVLDAFRHGILSYHHGDFRKYRGQPAGCWEFIHGEDEIGITLQRINEQLDAGEIALEKTVSIHDADTFAEIRSRLYANSVDMLATAVPKIASGELEFETIDDLGPLYTFPTGRDAWRFLRKEIRGTV